MNNFSFPLKKERVLAVGLMSGTSMDGIDAALVEINGSGLTTEVNLLHFKTLIYEEALKQNILNVCDPETSSVAQICTLNVVLAERMAEAVYQLVEQSEFSMADLDFVSSHGQTIYHSPDDQATLQIGELAVIAHRTKCITVGDFRPSDMAAGGQGAPLVPFVDQLLFRCKTKGRVLLNIGGISNLTVLPRTDDPAKNEQAIVAFDTGPGNVLIDEIVRIGSGQKLFFDENGELASSGHVCDNWLFELEARDPFLTLPFPKSTGREYYNRKMAEELWKEGKAKGLSFEDIVATIASYTVRAISYAILEQLDESSKLPRYLLAAAVYTISF